jgi:hypothetical protein
MLSFLTWLQAMSLSAHIRESLFIFPLLEAVHVVGLTLVVGTIMVIDLRLLGLASSERSFARMAADILKWTWAAFLVTAVTGALMFMTNAVVYADNTAFRVKIALLALAGLNTLVFERTAARTVRQWDRSPSAPPIAKAVATMSLAIWIAVIVAGRIIGFTTTRATMSAPADLNFENLLGLPADGIPKSPP